MSRVAHAMTSPTIRGEIEIVPQGPFSWDLMIESLGSFPPVQRHWSGRSLVRLAFPLDYEYEPVAVALWKDEGVLRGEVEGTTNLQGVQAQVERIFSLDYDGRDFPLVAERDPALAPLMEARRGQRPVCFTSPYETAAWAIISQRISKRQAARIQDSIIAEHGHVIRVADEDVRCFPVPERLLGVRSVAGLSDEKVERLHAVAQAALDGLLDAESLRALGHEAAPAALRAIRGIGPFWSELIYLRGCGIPDVFPNEPFAIAALGRIHGLGDSPSVEDVSRLTELYSPYRMWMCYLLRVSATVLEVGRALRVGNGARSWEANTLKR